MDVCYYFFSSDDMFLLPVCACMELTAHCSFNFVTSLHRYELCFSGEKPRGIGSSSNASDAEPEKHQSSSHHSQNGSVEHELRDVFRWSRCKKAMPESAMRSTGIPLPADQLEVFALPY
jgi:hypothetical protein